MKTREKVNIRHVARATAGGRVFRSSSDWYLRDSDGTTHGPYASSAEAVTLLLRSEDGGLIELPRPERQP